MSNLHAQPLLDVGALQQCALIDLTALPRIGFRGTHSADYLRVRGFELPEAPNRAVLQADGRDTGGPAANR